VLVTVVSVVLLVTVLSVVLDALPPAPPLPPEAERVVLVLPPAPVPPAPVVLAPLVVFPLGSSTATLLPQPIALMAVVTTASPNHEGEEKDKVRMTILLRQARVDSRSANRGAK
jgi:hypothetical protein